MGESLFSLVYVTLRLVFCSSLETYSFDLIYRKLSINYNIFRQEQKINFFAKHAFFLHMCIITVVGFSFQILAESEQDFLNNLFFRLLYLLFYMNLYLINLTI